LNTENFEKLDKMFRNVHAMVQHNCPLFRFKPLFIK